MAMPLACCNQHSCAAARQALPSGPQQGAGPPREMMSHVADRCRSAGTHALADTFLSGNVCREKAGSCDVAEKCSGLKKDCPPDGFVAKEFTCRWVS
jgi:hypothetical protein